MATKKTRKPGRSFTDIEQGGEKALGLVKKHDKQVTPRLPAGTVDGLAGDLDLLRGLVPGAKLSRARSKTATVTQASALEQAHVLVSAVRKAVQTAGAPAAVRRGYGVGQNYNARLVSHAVAGITQIVKRAKKDPEEARSMGILAQDIKALEAALANVQAKDAEQEEARASAPVTTRERNLAAKRAIAAINRIAGAGALAFATEPTKRAPFEALLGFGARKRKKTTKKT